MLTVADGEIELTALGRRCVPAWLGLGIGEPGVLTVKVTLEESAAPVVWRRLRVPADIRLDRFHQVLGAAMGWQDSHLHVFERGDERYGHPDPELEIEDDRTKTLGELLVALGERLAYEYDFGDGWRHDIVLEASEPATTADASAVHRRRGPLPARGRRRHLRIRAPQKRARGPARPRARRDAGVAGLADAREFDAGAFDLDRDAAVAGVLVARR